MRDHARPPVYLNGRFLRQTLSGVQRFASEITAAMATHNLLSGIILPGATQDPANTHPDDQFDSVRHITAGTGSGHLWEQTTLPRAASPGLLINLGNTAPVCKRRQIVVIHDCGWATEPGAYTAKFRMAYRLIQTALVRRGARIVTVSAFSRDEIVKHLGANREDIDIIPEGGEHISRVPRDMSALSEHGLEAGRYVLAVGNLVAHKNLRALSLLGETLQRRGYVLAIVGARREGIFQAQNGNDLPQAATYLGRVSDGALRVLYENAACFVFPSRYEGFGLPPVEAMACGCPVVASDIPVLREICGDAALFADPSSPAAFVHNVMNVLQNDGVAATLRNRGYERGRIYNWQRAGVKMAEIIRNAGYMPAKHHATRQSAETGTV